MVFFFDVSGGGSPPYIGHPDDIHTGGQGSRGPKSPQTEPVDFSAPPRPMPFSMVGPIGPTPYSRESTPDSAASHYMDSYRDPSGMWQYKKEYFTDEDVQNLQKLFQLRNIISKDMYITLSLVPCILRSLA